MEPGQAGPGWLLAGGWGGELPGSLALAAGWLAGCLWAGLVGWLAAGGPGWRLPGWLASPSWEQGPPSQD